MGIVKICEVVDNCEECPRYGDDCDGDKRVEHTDTISRADAIEVVRKCVVESELLADWNKAMESAQVLLSALPSADDAQGEWIEKYNGNGWNDFWDYTCSNCGKKYERADAVLYHANYCPNCGARMKGGDDE